MYKLKHPPKSYRVIIARDAFERRARKRLQRRRWRKRFRLLKGFGYFVMMVGLMFIVVLSALAGIGAAPRRRRR